MKALARPVDSISSGHVFLFPVANLFEFNQRTEIRRRPEERDIGNLPCWSNAECDDFLLIVRRSTERSSGKTTCPRPLDHEKADSAQRLCHELGRASVAAFVVSPGDFEHIADMLVPELPRRGRCKDAYAEGTLREKLFGAGRARLSAPHPAARHRPRPRAKTAE
jgi:hypothetical protein